MFKFFWKYFPIFYVLPFLMATTQPELVAQVGEKLRWVILGVGCLLAVHFGFRRLPFKMKKLHFADGVIISFIGLFLLSAAWSIDPVYTVQRAISLMLLYICSFWLLWRYADQFSADILIRNLLYTVGAFLAVNLVVGTLYPPYELLSFRFKGLFQNPNNIGLIASLALPLAASRLLRTRGGIDLAVTVVIVMNLLLSGTRSSLLGVVVALAIIMVSLLVKQTKRAIIIGILGLVAVGMFIQTDFFEENILREETLTTASNRTFIWELAKSYISKRPDVGHGFATDAVIHEYYGISLHSRGLRGYGAASSYYGLAIQMGWYVTYVFFALLWGFTLLYIFRYWRDYELVAYVAAMISGLIVCIFEPSIYSAGNPFSFLFWACVMLAVRRDKYRRVRRAEVNSTGAVPRWTYTNRRLF